MASGKGWWKLNPLRLILVGSDGDKLASCSSLPRERLEHALPSYPKYTLRSYLSDTWNTVCH